MAQFFRPTKKASLGVATLSIDGCDHQGRGVARHEGKVWFVDGALQGETIKAQAAQNKSKFVEAKVVKVLTPSVNRVVPFCADFERCGGCQLQHQNLNAQVQDKQQAVSALFKKFAQQNTLPWQAPIIGESRHYRRSARLACFYDKSAERLRVGFREKGAKTICEIVKCEILSERFSAHIPALREALNQDKQFASVSHIQLSDTKNHGYVVVRHLKPISCEAKQIIETHFSDRGWRFVWQSSSDELGEMDYELPSYVLPRYDLQFQYRLNNFVQVNAKVNEAMIQQAMDWLQLTKHDVVLDLFSGIGNFSLVAAKYAKAVIGVEGVESSVAMARQNAHTNSLTNTAFYCADLTDNLAKEGWFGSQANVLLLDPSREGAEAVLKQLPLKQFDKILYVSCDPVTLARDSAEIFAAQFTLTRLGLMNMFPHTGHIESMALFQRR
ncbi:23S rRNA (Uracil-5-)-methyltransferase RumA [Pseudoalteromonas luteoviolacea B = ATCC 29581]|nr:23S rRNA (Uracil-5-)-methyltransferase RumA [Pseudoalteromonas luteoviolacea B = ATCC 29581]